MEAFKELDADKNHFFFEVQGAGTEASPYARPVSVKNGHSQIVDLMLGNSLGAFTLAADTVIDDVTFEAGVGHGIIPGDGLLFTEGACFSQFVVTGVSVDTITVDSPFDVPYTSGATMTRSLLDMLTGTATASAPEEWHVAPPSGQAWDINRVILVIESTATAMDFVGFGNLPALANGAVLRVLRGDGTAKNIFNWKSNGDFINRGYDAIFQSKTGGGRSGFTSRSTFSGAGKRGASIRLDGTAGDALQVLIQDPTNGIGLEKVRMIAQGHVVSQ